MYTRWRGAQISKLFPIGSSTPRLNPIGSNFPIPFFWIHSYGNNRNVYHIKYESNKWIHSAINSLEKKSWIHLNKKTKDSNVDSTFQ